VPGLEFESVAGWVLVPFPSNDGPESDELRSLIIIVWWPSNRRTLRPEGSEDTGTSPEAAGGIVLGSLQSTPGEMSRMRET
jgi:hypothetical protein